MAVQGGHIHRLRLRRAAACRRVSIKQSTAACDLRVYFDNGRLLAGPLYYGLHLFSELVANHSRWLQVNVSAAGQSPAPTPTSDPACKNGIHENHDCCAEECGSCGGPGCNDRPGSFFASSFREFSVSFLSFSSSFGQAAPTAAAVAPSPRQTVPAPTTSPLASLAAQPRHPRL